MREMMFSRVFPAYHNEAGKPTYFVEKIWENDPLVKPMVDFEVLANEIKNFSLIERLPKFHTIRSGNRFKEGDWFVPKVWIGKPYRSKKAQFADPIQVVKIYDFELTDNEYLLNGKELSLKELRIVANNDGLASDDFELWFSKYKTFKGQVICWLDPKY